MRSVTNRAASMSRLGADVPKMKERLTHAFKLMRSEGLLALQRTPCCSGCAHASLSQKLTERATRGKVYDGVVHYHSQDAEAIDRMFKWYAYIQRHDDLGDLNRMAWREATLFIRYSSTEKYNPDATRSRKDVGKLIQRCLKRASITSYWNGDPDTCIRVPLLQDHMASPFGTKRR